MLTDRQTNNKENITFLGGGNCNNNSNKSAVLLMEENYCSALVGVLTCTTNNFIITIAQFSR